MQSSPSSFNNRAELPVTLQLAAPLESGRGSGSWAGRAAASYGAASKELADEAESTPARFTPLPPGADADQVMLDHLPMVRFLARRVHERLPQHVEMEDLVSAGVVGLIDAFHKFDPSKQVQFRSYAQFRVRGTILDSLRALDWGPRELRRKGRQIEDAIQSLNAKLGRCPSEAEIASEMHLTLEQYQQVLGDLRGLDIGALNAEHSEGSEDELAHLAGDPEENPLLQCERSETKARLAQAVAELPERERMVLTLYYYEEMTMREVGLTLNVVESRVSQIHSSAMARLRAALRVPRSPARRVVASRKTPARSASMMLR